MNDSDKTTTGRGTGADSGRNSGRWERGVLENLVLAQVHEQRRARRWSMFFRLFIALYLLLVLAIYVHNLGYDEHSLSGGGKHTALVQLSGVIAEDAEANADDINQALRGAFEDKNTAGVILRVNSPGGSPVQAGQIHDEMIRLREKYPDIPLHVVIDDICASGGYYVAAAADKIYADKASVVGSVGVIMSGFGFVDAMDKLGIERRLLTAGENKALLDPFSPKKEAEQAHLQSMLDQIHQQFIDVVKKGRGGHLKDDDQLFSGLVWTGEKAVELGLVDALGSADYVAREVIGEEDVIEFSRKTDVLERLADRMGVSLGRVLAEQGGLGLVLR